MVVVAPDRPQPDPDASARQRDLAPLEAAAGARFRDGELLRAALTHPSYANEHPEDPSPTNERLEFLGDAILGAVVAEALYRRFPGVQEGRLTEWRAQLVCGPTLSRIATERLDLGDWLRLGRGEERTGGRTREGNLERAYEAIVGALYLDGGLEAARAFVEHTLGEELTAIERDPAVLNPKGAFQQLAQEHVGRPEYRVLSEEGPEHSRHFTVEVRLAGEVLGQGSGSSKQEAEKQAAREALTRLRARVAASAPPAGRTAGAGGDGRAGNEPGAGGTRATGPGGPEPPGSGA